MSQESDAQDALAGMKLGYLVLLWTPQNGWWPLNHDGFHSDRTKAQRRYDEVKRLLDSRHEDYDVLRIIDIALPPVPNGCREAYWHLMGEEKP